MRFIAKTLEDTSHFASKLAKKLKQGDVVLLSGDLGAGKTTFTKFLCQHLGVKDMVTSPTFTIINEYDGVLPIYHMDMYRIESFDEAVMTGCVDIIQSNNGLCLIEWPDVLVDVLPAKCIRININKSGENRIFNVEGL